MEKFCGLIGENLINNFCIFYKKMTGENPSQEEVELFFKLLQNDVDLKNSISNELIEATKEIDRIDFIINSRYPVTSEELNSLLESINQKHKEREHLQNQLKEIESKNSLTLFDSFLSERREKLLLRKSSLLELSDTANFFQNKLDKNNIIQTLNVLIVELEKKNEIIDSLTFSSHEIQDQLEEIETKISILKGDILFNEKQLSEKKSQIDRLYVDFSSRELLSRVKELKEELQNDLEVVETENQEIKNLKALTLEYNKKIELLKTSAPTQIIPSTEEKYKKESLSSLQNEKEKITSKLTVVRHLIKELSNLKTQEKLLLEEYARAQQQVNNIREEAKTLDGDAYFSLQRSYEIAQENLIASKLILQKLQQNITEREINNPIGIEKTLELELLKIETQIKEIESSQNEKLFRRIAKEQQTKTLEKELEALQELIDISQTSIIKKEKKIKKLSNHIKEIQTELLERFSDFVSLPLETIKESLEIVLNAEDFKIELEENTSDLNNKLKNYAFSLLELTQKYSLLKEQLITKSEAIAFLQNNIAELQNTFKDILSKNSFVSEEDVSSYLLTEEEENHLQDWIDNYQFQLRHLDEELLELGQSFEEPNNSVEFCQIKLSLLERIIYISEELGALEAHLNFLTSEKDTDKEYIELRNLLLKKQNSLKFFSTIFDGNEFLRLLSFIS
jgi:chromosome segregation ATPase